MGARACTRVLRSVQLPKQPDRPVLLLLLVNKKTRRPTLVSDCLYCLTSKEELNHWKHVQDKLYLANNEGDTAMPQRTAVQAADDDDERRPEAAPPTAEQQHGRREACLLRASDRYQL
jgi:hypothetical protein